MRLSNLMDKCKIKTVFFGLSNVVEYYYKDKNITYDERPFNFIIYEFTTNTAFVCKKKYNESFLVGTYQNIKMDLNLNMEDSDEI